MKSKFFNYFRYLFMALLFVLGPLVFYQNCGKIGLKANLKSVDTSSLASVQTRGVVPLPTQTSGDLRAVFFIDDSRSMVEGLCTNTIDYDTFVVPPPVAQCSRDAAGLSGVDHDLKRVKIIRQWIRELEEVYATRPDLLAKVKMLILPFSGGYAQGYLDNQFESLPASRAFSSLEETKKALDRIETIQSIFSKLPGAPKPDPGTANMSYDQVIPFLGTSVPGAKIEKSMLALKAELEILKSRPGARIEYVFISDGVPKPRADHIVTAAKVIWASAQEVVATGNCLAPPGQMPWGPPDPNDPNPYVCLEQEFRVQGFDNCSATCEGAVRDWATIGTLTAEQVRTCDQCIQALARVTGSPFTDAANNTWGSSLDNTVPAIFRSIGKLKTQQDQYPDTSYRFTFLRLDTLSPANYATPTIEKDPQINWQVRAPALYRSGHRSRLVTVPTVDFGLFPGLSKNESYKLESIVALNINTRVNSVGVLDLDSDGDGLFDFEENQLPITEADPQKSRTNGVCLDSITFALGCITAGCDKDIDRDGDGLNECEERTVGTSDEDFDSDGDGIPDSMEIIYGYNPLVSDRDLNSSVDELDNYEQWKMGVPGSFSVTNTNPEFLTQVTAEPLGQKSIQDSFNRTILVPEYMFQIENMHTSVTKPAQDIGPMYTSKTRQASTQVKDRIVGGSHALGVNRIIVIGKVVSVQNVGDAYWIGKILEVTHDPVHQVIQLPFDQLLPLKVIDLVEGTP